MVKVHIFGLDHFHQNLETGCRTSAGIADEQTQKVDLASTLGAIIDNQGVELVAEEGKPDRPCLGYILAKERALGHINITMPLEERLKSGIRTPEYDHQDETRSAGAESGLGAESGNQNF